MTFEPEDLGDQPADGAAATTAPAPAEGLPRAVVLVIRSGDAEPELARALTESLSRQVLATGKVEVMPSEDFHVRLFAPGERAAQDCVTNAVCLSGYGKELWLDKIVMGVLYKGEGGYNVNVDLVGVENAEVEQYANRDLHGLPAMDREAMDREMNGMVFKLFGLVDPSLHALGPRKKLVARAGPVQTGFAWTSAGLAGAVLITGAVFGAQARSIASELDREKGLTQREAWDKVDEGESKALSAYLSFAAGGVLVAASAALFLLKPLQEEEVQPGPATPGFEGGEAEPEAGLAPYLLPMIGADGAGLALGLQF
ncbi:MAG: hypothetical protein FJ125_18480 [Deltaproteobacteria bacterium]|nr:hypothetical protein [Deltaproteobacteria bacterium]